MSCHVQESRRAFSLLELLVLSSVIVMLVTLLLPTLIQSREAGRLAMCSSNQRQIGIDMVDDLNNNDMVFPSLYYVMQHSDPSILVDPSDPNPVTLPSDVIGTDYDVSMSYAVNPEFFLNGVSFDNLSKPSGTIMMYDGFGGGVDGYSQDGSSSGSFDGNAVVDGNKVTITHFPPGNKGNFKVVTIGLSALHGHIDNDDHRSHIDLFGNWLVEGDINVPYALRGDFQRRHWRAKPHGVVLFADGHVEALTELDDSMFLNPDVPLPPGYGEDDGGNGNGNGSGNGNSK